MSAFESSLASRFSTISDISRISQASSPLAQLGLSRSDLSQIIARPIDLGPIISHVPIPTPTPTPLTPADAGTFIGSVAETPQQIVSAAVHAARLAFEAIPTAQDGDVIDASIPNGFRSALITLLSLADATVQRLMQPRPPVISGVPPIHLPPIGVSPPPVGVSPPPVSVTPPPTGGGIGVLHIDPSVIHALAPATVVTPPSGDPAETPSELSPHVSLPSIDFGGTMFDAQTLTHPETGETTTVFVERATTPAATTGTAAGTAAGAATGTLAGTSVTGALASPAPSFTLSAVSGGGFQLSPGAFGGITGR